MALAPSFQVCFARDTSDKPAKTEGHAHQEEIRHTITVHSHRGGRVRDLPPAFDRYAAPGWGHRWASHALHPLRGDQPRGNGWGRPLLRGASRRYAPTRQLGCFTPCTTGASGDHLRLSSALGLNGTVNNTEAQAAQGGPLASRLRWDLFLCCGSQDSAYYRTYRRQLRPSSQRGPRHPPQQVVHSRWPEGPPSSRAKSGQLANWWPSLWSVRASQADPCSSIRCSHAQNSACIAIGLVGLLRPRIASTRSRALPGRASQAWPTGLPRGSAWRGDPGWSDQISPAGPPPSYI